MRGEPIVRLIEGVRMDDHLALPTRTFAPVKLTKQGTLLLRAILGKPGRVREGLLVLDRLFD